MKILGKALLGLLCVVSVFVSSCSSNVTPGVKFRLDLDNFYVTQESINSGPVSPYDVDIVDDFTVDGGYWAVTLIDKKEFPVLTGIVPPGWAVVDVQRPPVGAVGALGTPSGVADGDVVPTVVLSIVDLGVSSLAEAQKLGMSPFRSDLSEIWESRMLSDGNSYSSIYHGIKHSDSVVLEMISSVEYVEWDGKVIGFSSVFTKDPRQVNELWDETNQVVLYSIRLHKNFRNV